MENNLLNPALISLEKNIFNEDQLNLSEVFKAFSQDDFKDIKLENFLRANLPEHLKNFKKYKISKSVYEGINSKRETTKLIKAISLQGLESM
jgi:xanthine dehydrogenase iron-sulfur cluster and FAD-binding subunit A